MFLIIRYEFILACVKKCPWTSPGLACFSPVRRTSTSVISINLIFLDTSQSNISYEGNQIKRIYSTTKGSFCKIKIIILVICLYRIHDAQNENDAEKTRTINRSICLFEICFFFLRNILSSDVRHCYYGNSLHSQLA